MLHARVKAKQRGLAVSSLSVSATARDLLGQLRSTLVLSIHPSGFRMSVTCANKRVFDYPQNDEPMIIT